MTFKYYHIAAIILAQYPLSSHGQEVNEYRLQYGLSFGYRSFNLDEVDQRLNYFFDGYVKPDNGSTVLSADIKGRPFKKNPFFLNFRFDFMPVYTRSYSERIPDDPRIFPPSKSGQVDTIYSYDGIYNSTQTKMYFASLQVGTDINLGKLQGSIGCGAILGYLSMNQLQSQINYYKDNQGPYYPSPPQMMGYYYQTQKNIGFIASGSLLYPLRSRLNANISFSFIILDPEVTYEHYTIPVTEGYFGVKDYGFYYPRVLTAQLSGIQVTAGLSYVLF